MSAVTDPHPSQVQGNGHPAPRPGASPSGRNLPDDLVPRPGSDAYERTTCTSVHLLDIPGPDDLKQVDGHLQVDLAEPLEKLGTFDRPADGVVLTTEQSWYLRGVTRGQLSHSLALAPGEATRVAIVDWSRRTRGTQTGETAQTDTTTAASDRGRAISELAEALAREEQTGQSSDTSDSAAVSASASASYSGALFSGTANVAGAYTHDTATHVSRATGERHLSSQNAQRLSDRTQQQATALRSRRATVVQETTQAETSQATTRIVVNYNHMHALTVQYYEMVQTFDVCTQTKRADRCVFLPMKLQPFTGDAGRRLLERHHLLFAAVAPPVWQNRFRDFDPLASTTVRCAATVQPPPDAGAEYRTNAVGHPEKSGNQSFDWHVPHAAAQELVLWWDGDKVRALQLTMTDGQHAAFGDGGYSRASLVFDQGDVATGRLPERVTKILVAPGGYDYGAVGGIALETDAGRTLEATGGANAPGEELVNVLMNTDPVSHELVDTILTGVHGTVDSKDGWHYLSSLGFYLRPQTAVFTPFETMTGQAAIQRLDFWWDEDKICALSMSLDNGFAARYGDPSIEAAQQHDGIDLSGEQLSRLVIRTTRAGAAGRSRQGAVAQVHLQTTTQTKVFGPAGAPAEGWESEQESDVRSGVLLSVFGTAALSGDTHFFTSLGFVARVPQTRPDDLLAHLQANGLYYNQALWASVDPLALGSALTRYSMDPPPETPPCSSFPAAGNPDDAAGGRFDDRCTSAVRTLELFSDDHHLVGVRITTADGTTFAHGTVEGAGVRAARTELASEPIRTLALGATSDGSAPARLELTTAGGPPLLAGPGTAPPVQSVTVDGCVLAGVFGTLGGDERGLEILPAYGNDEEALALSVDEADPATPVILVGRDPDAPGQRWWRRQVGDSFQLVHQATGKVARYTGQGSPVQLAAADLEDPASRWRSATENGLVRLRPVSDPMGGLTPRDGWVAGTPVVGTNAMLGQGTMFTLTGGDRHLSSLGLWLAPAGSYDGSRARRPLAASVDPVPVAMTQNYLGFRWHFRSEHERATWLAEHDLTEGPDTDVWTQVSLPTGGLFAEAVLGESNSAERLDLTRFWDWQDSPIPFGPGAIAPPSTGTRATAMDLTAPDVGASAAVLPAVQAAPDPATTAALLSAMATQHLIDPQLTVSSASPSKAGAVLNAAMDLDAKRVALATELAKAKAEKEKAENEKAEKEKAGTAKAGTGKAGTAADETVPDDTSEQGTTDETDGTAIEGHGEQPEGHGERPEGHGERPEGHGQRPEGQGELPEGETTGTGTWAVLPDTADTAVATELRAILTMIGGRAVSPAEEERKHDD